MEPGRQTGRGKAGRICQRLSVIIKQARKRRHECRHAEQGRQAATGSERGTEAGRKVEETGASRQMETD